MNKKTLYNEKLTQLILQKMQNFYEKIQTNSSIMKIEKTELYQQHEQHECYPEIENSVEMKEMRRQKTVLKEKMHKK